MLTRIRRLETWVFENAVAAAVFCAFCHMSISERMRERQAAQARPTVDCHAKLVWFFAAKKVLFAVTFVDAKLWPLLAGSALFLLYSPWRRFWRRVHPMSEASSG